MISDFFSHDEGTSDVTDTSNSYIQTRVSTVKHTQQNACFAQKFNLNHFFWVAVTCVGTKSIFEDIIYSENRNILCSTASVYIFDT